MTEREVSTPIVVVIVTFAVLFLGFAVAGLVFFVRRRKKFPLNGRDPALIVIVGVGSAVTGVYFPISGITDVSCTVAALIELNIGFLAVTAMLMRLLRLWFLYYAAEEQVKRHRAKFSGEAPTWFADHRHYTSTKFIMKMLFAIFGAHFLITELTFALAPETTVPINQKCPNLGIALLFASAFDFLVVVLVLVTAWRIRHIKDGFGIRKELIYTTLTAVLVLPAIDLHETVLTDVEFPIFAFLILIGCTFEIAVIFYFPLYLSKKHERIESIKRERMQKAHLTRIMDLTLKDILTLEEHADLLEDFEQHLSTEFSFENMMFWKRAGEYTAGYDKLDDEGVMKRAVEIYNDFIRPGGPFEANLPHPIRKGLTKRLCDSIEGFTKGNSQQVIENLRSTTRVDRDVFDLAQASVFRLMALDTFVRWQLKTVQTVTADLESLTNDTRMEHSRVPQSMHDMFQSQYEDERRAPFDAKKATTDIDELCEEPEAAQSV